MGRPKASPKNLSIVLAFADAITLPTSPDPSNLHSVGSNELFSIIAKCFPFLVRNSLDRRPANRSALSAVEFRKHLCRSGRYVARRRRQRIAGERDRWTTSELVWTSRRWADPSDPRDIAHIEAHVRELQRSHPVLLPNLDLHRLSRLILDASSGKATVASCCDTPYPHTDDETGLKGEESDEGYYVRKDAIAQLDGVSSTPQSAAAAAALLSRESSAAASAWRGGAFSRRRPAAVDSDHRRAAVVESDH